MASAALLVAYALTATEIMPPAALAIHLLNLVGALGIGMVTYIKKAYQALTVNVVWGLVALFGIVQYFIKLRL